MPSWLVLCLFYFRLTLQRLDSLARLSIFIMAEPIEQGNPTQYAASSDVQRLTGLVTSVANNVQRLAVDNRENVMCLVEAVKGVSDRVDGHDEEFKDVKKRLHTLEQKDRKERKRRMLQMGYTMHPRALAYSDSDDEQDDDYNMPPMDPRFPVRGYDRTAAAARSSCFHSGKTNKRVKQDESIMLLCSSCYSEDSDSENDRTMPADPSFGAETNGQEGLAAHDPTYVGPYWIDPNEQKKKKTKNREPRRRCKNCKRWPQNGTGRCTGHLDLVLFPPQPEYNKGK